MSDACTKWYKLEAEIRQRTYNKKTMCNFGILEAY